VVIQIVRKENMHIVKIGAAWCSGCLVMKPRWAEIEKELLETIQKYENK
jgi:hypothetical protein